jgi:hypothetical protein
MQPYMASSWMTNALDHFAQLFRFLINKKSFIGTYRDVLVNMRQINHQVVVVGIRFTV